MHYASHLEPYPLTTIYHTSSKGDKGSAKAFTSEMKTWFEFPEETRFARTGRADILYTPIYFANEGIKAKFCLDNEWAATYEDFSQLEAKVQLIGKASLGFLSIGGRPVSTFDNRYALPTVGFRPIYTLTILETSRRIRLEEAIENHVPFEFRLHTATLDDLQQLASSLKVVTADTASTMDLFREISPALIVSVQYALVGTVHYQGEKKSEHDSEIRIFASLAEGQVPHMTPENIGNNPLACVSETGIVGLGKSKPPSTSGRRRDSLPLIRRLSRSGSIASVSTSSSSMQESYLVVEAQTVEPFVFRTRDEASAIKVKISLTYHGGDSADDEDSDENPPPPVSATVATMLKSLTSLTLEPIRPEDRSQDEEQQSDEFFHLRSKILPGKKLKVNFGEWKKVALTSAALSAAQIRAQVQAAAAQHETEPALESRRRASTMPTAIGEEASIPERSTQSITGSSTMTTTATSSTTTTAQPPQTTNTIAATTATTADTQSTPTTSTPPSLPTTTTAPPLPRPNPPTPPTITIPAPPKRWTTTTDLWLTHPITTTLTPSFTTPYISHLYTLTLSMNLHPETSSSNSPTTKSFKSLRSGFGPSKPTIELNIPVQVRYDLGLVPSYEIDGTLPEYDYSLPLYEDAVGLNPGAQESLTRTDPDNTAESTAGNPIEPDAAYEARVTGTAGGADGTSGTATDGHTHHAWRHANIDEMNVASADGDDDDVLDMLMRRGGGGETRPTTGRRRVYGDTDGGPGS